MLKFVQTAYQKWCVAGTCFGIAWFTSFIPQKISKLLLRLSFSGKYSNFFENNWTFQKLRNFRDTFPVKFHFCYLEHIPANDVFTLLSIFSTLFHFFAFLTHFYISPNYSNSVNSNNRFQNSVKLRIYGIVQTDVISKYTCHMDPAIFQLLNKFETCQLINTQPLNTRSSNSCDAT